MLRIQLLSDLHLETEDFEPQPAPGADLLVLAGDIDTTWRGLERFTGWPQPVLFVAGNHEFDRRELTEAWPQLRERCARLGLTISNVSAGLLRTLRASACASSAPCAGATTTCRARPNASALCAPAATSCA